MKAIHVMSHVIFHLLLRGLRFIPNNSIHYIIQSILDEAQNFNSCSIYAGQQKNGPFTSSNKPNGCGLRVYLDDAMNKPKHNNE
jgi:hypothetical protein